MSTHTGDSSGGVLHVHDLNKDVFKNRLAFLGCLIVLYCCVSLAFYSGYEDMGVLDAIYFAIMTMATVSCMW